MRIKGLARLETKYFEEPWILLSRGLTIEHDEKGSLVEAKEKGTNQPTSPAELYWVKERSVRERPAPQRFTPASKASCILKWPFQRVRE